MLDLRGSSPPSPKPDVLYERLALIGSGLIGSSIARAARRAGAVRSIALQSRSQQTVDRAEALGLADHYTTSAAEAVRNADLVIVAVPVGASGEIARQIAPQMKEGATVTDVGSVKASVVRQMQPHLPPRIHLIPGHPIAGSDRSGPEAGMADMFEDRWCILTPPVGADPAALAALSGFWRALGARTDVMTPTRHDGVLAMISHLPHVLAFNMIQTASGLETSDETEILKYAGGGFRDFTRIAGSDPVMWRDILLHNRDAVLDVLGRFRDDLQVLERAICSGEGTVLHDAFAAVSDVRRNAFTADRRAPDEPSAVRRPPHGRDPRPAQGRFRLGAVRGETTAGRPPGQGCVPARGMPAPAVPRDGAEGSG